MLLGRRAARNIVVIALAVCVHSELIRFYFLSSFRSCFFLLFSLVSVASTSSAVNCAYVVVTEWFYISLLLLYRFPRAVRINIILSMVCLLPPRRRRQDSNRNDL